MKARRQLINLGSRNTDYRVGEGLLSELDRFVAGVVGRPNRALLALREGEREAAATATRRSLIDAGFSVCEVALPASGLVATLARATALYERMDEARLTADDVVIALGDAEVCALAAFCARTWYGGTACVLLPTTLDAMCTAGTSLAPLDAGAAVQALSIEPYPDMVVCDLSLVLGEKIADENDGASPDAAAPDGEVPSDAAVSGEEAPAMHLLPAPELVNGGYLAMMAGTLANGRGAWDRFGRSVPFLAKGIALTYVDELCCAQQARKAIRTATNPSARAALDFGVPTARALRTCLGDAAPAWQLLAEGMRFEARLAVDAAGFDVDEVFEQDDRMEALGIPELAFDLDVDGFLDALKGMRFRRANRFLLSLPKNVGTVRLTSVDDDVLREHAEAYLASRAGLMAGE